MWRMSQTRFHVRAMWDDEAEVYISKSDIRGLVVETQTLDEFEEVVLDLGPVMIRDNHPQVADTIPTIVLLRPEPAVHA